MKKIDLEIPICTILGVNIAAVDMPWVMNFTRKYVNALSGEYCCVTNVHTTVTAFQDEAFRDVMNGSILALPDGGPLSSVGKKRGFENMSRVTGPDYMMEILKISEKEGYRHFFFGSTQDTLDKMKKVLQKDFPELQIAGMISPPFSKEIVVNEEYIRMINEAKPDFVWVGLGAPKQEKWMAAHHGKIEGFMVGVGAGFDYLAGNIKRAPLWMQKANLEWLYRLLQDPKRLFKRYLITNFIFLWEIIICKK